MDIWAACRKQASPVSIKGKLIRVVESQTQIATSHLVSNLAEQAALEAMLEQTKPALPAETHNLHYLLATPFRYPPLQHGSRFGSRFEPSLLYGSKTISTALTETAYYRFVFWSGIAEPPASKMLRTQHTLFAANYRTDKSLCLQNQPFSAYQKALTDPGSYLITQQLGNEMRKASIEVFEYLSARDPDQGHNVALFKPGALASRRPLYQQRWLCETSAEVVSFTSRESETVYRFEQDVFLVDDQLPQPAV